MNDNINAKEDIHCCINDGYVLVVALWKSQKVRSHTASHNDKPTSTSFKKKLNYLHSAYEFPYCPKSIVGIYDPFACVLTSAFSTKHIAIHFS